MKKILYVVLLLLGVGIMTSCNKNNASSNGIVGSWKCVYGKTDSYATEGSVWTFEAGGTWLKDGYPVAQYRYDEQTRIIKWGGSGAFYVQSLTATMMRLGSGPEEPDYYWCEFERVK